MAAKQAEVEAVKYIGIAMIRRITEDEWREAGVKNQSTVQWNSLNGWTVPGDKLNADAIRVLEQDDGMALLRKGEQPEEESEE